MLPSVPWIVERHGPDQVRKSDAETIPDAAVTGAAPEHDDDDEEEEDMMPDEEVSALA